MAPCNLQPNSLLDFLRLSLDFAEQSNEGRAVNYFSSLKYRKEWGNLLPFKVIDEKNKLKQMFALFLALKLLVLFIPWILWVIQMGAVRVYIAWLLMFLPLLHQHFLKRIVKLCNKAQTILQTKGWKPEKIFVAISFLFRSCLPLISAMLLTK